MSLVNGIVVLALDLPRKKWGFGKLPVLGILKKYLWEMISCMVLQSFATGYVLPYELLMQVTGDRWQSVFCSMSARAHLIISSGS